MRRTKAVTAVASLCLVLGAAGCGGKDGESKEDLVRDISSTLQSDGEGFTKEQSDCFAEIVVDEAGVKALQDVDISADDPPKAIQDDIAKATVRAKDECDLAPPG